MKGSMIKTRGLFKKMEVIKNIGLKSVLATTLVFLLTAAATGVGGYQLYKSTKESGFSLQPVGRE